MDAAWMAGRSMSCDRFGSRRASCGERTAPRTSNGAGTRSSRRCTVRVRRIRGISRIPRGPDRRSVEISKVISEAFSSVVFAEQFPRTSVDIFIEVLQADAGTRCAGLTAASVALADAGVPMRDLVTSCASGKIDGVVCLDLNKDEDNFGDADCPMAIVPRTGDVVLLQMDGHLTYDEFQKAMGLSIDAARRIYEMQRDALRRRYSTVAEQARLEAPPPPPPAEAPPPPEDLPEDMPEDPGPEVDDL